MSVPGPQNTQTGEPSLIHGHANLARGAFDSAVGSVTGSEPWSEAGTTAKMEGVEELKSYGEKHPPHAEGATVTGKAESMAGTAVGCGGMAKEGELKQQQ